MSDTAAATVDAAPQLTEAEVRNAQIQSMQFVFNKDNWLDWFLLFLPNLLSLFSMLMYEYSCQTQTKMKSAGKNVPYTPPKWVFMFVWPVLYILLGLSLVQFKNSTLYVIVCSIELFLLLMWPYVYTCVDMRNALYLLVAILVLTFILCSYNWLVFMMLAPLAGWLIYAMIISSTEINNLAYKLGQQQHALQNPNLSPQSNRFY